MIEWAKCQCAIRTQVALVLAALLISPTAARAQAPAEFFKDKQVSLYIGFPPGGGYDLYARVLARHLGKHIPGNPAVVPRNMEGAGSIRVANFIYTQAPRDGTAIATIGRGAAFGPLFGQPGAQFDAQKFLWLGSANNEVSTCVAWHTSGVTTFEQARQREVILGATGVSDESTTTAKMLNGVLGSKFKIISSYTGSTQVLLAMERKEVEGRCGISWDNIKGVLADWIQEKKVHILIQIAYQKAPDLQDVPLAGDLAKTPEQKQIVNLFAAPQIMGRPYFAPPDIPRDRAEILRKAFMATLSDPAFLDEAKKAKLEISAVPGQRVQDVVGEVYATPREVVQKAITLMK